jgi:hypothetical protein
MFMVCIVRHRRTPAKSPAEFTSVAAAAPADASARKKVAVRRNPHLPMVCCHFAA